MKLIRNKEPAGIASVFVYFAIKSANFYCHNSAREMKVCLGYAQMIVDKYQVIIIIMFLFYDLFRCVNCCFSQTNLLF